MNNITRLLHIAATHSKDYVLSLSQRVLNGNSSRYHAQTCRPQWQQLELPLSRTSVKRWNR